MMEHGLRSIGFFPITADPIHFGHILGGMAALKHCGLDFVLIDVAGEVRHKNVFANQRQRHDMARLAIKKHEPYLRYSSIGRGNDLSGEERFVRFFRSRYALYMKKIYYIAGIDNAFRVEEFFRQRRPIGKCDFAIAFLSRAGWTYTGQHQVVPFEGKFSSSTFRTAGDIGLVSNEVIDYCKQHHLYGF